MRHNPLNYLFLEQLKVSLSLFLSIIMAQNPHHDSDAENGVHIDSICEHLLAGSEYVSF